MLKTTEKYAETIKLKGNIDALSGALRALRISGSILLKEEYAPPWAIAIPDSEALGAALKLGRGVRAIDFHFVRRGHIEITQENGQRTLVEAGEMAICFGGKPHWISQGDTTNSISVSTLLKGEPHDFQPNAENRARSASLICGVFMMQDVQLNPLYASLPPVMHLSRTPSTAGYDIAQIMDRIAQEIEQRPLGSSYMVERLLELLCMESLRAHIASAPSSGSGWFNGLKDPVVGRAISMIHANPSADWSVERLAQGVTMSPSRFAARFTVAVGESPISYVAKWRMNVAGRLLDNTQDRIGKIATEVGYENAAAFNRAFKKHLGMPPAAWRNRGAN